MERTFEEGKLKGVGRKQNPCEALCNVTDVKNCGTESMLLTNQTSLHGTTIKLKNFSLQFMSIY
jgi:hypothetical protein